VKQLHVPPQLVHPGSHSHVLVTVLQRVFPPLQSPSSQQPSPGWPPPTCTQVAPSQQYPPPVKQLHVPPQLVHPESHTQVSLASLQ
jgi:hypothetical protein